METGQPIPFYSYAPITQAQLRAYAEASGDFNPIHLDEETAKRVGLPGVIAHGMLIAALVANRAKQFVKTDLGSKDSEYELFHFQTRFKAMTHLGDTPKVGGVVKQSGDDEFTLELQAKNERDEVTLLATTRFRKAR